MVWVATLLALLATAAVDSVGAITCSTTNQSPKSQATMWPLQSTSSRGTTIDTVLGPVVKSVGASCAAKVDAMKVDAHSFYRANNPLYYTDMSSTTKGVKASSVYVDTSATPVGRTWLGGDMHFTNMGTFAIATAETSSLYSTIFDVTDFDESWTGSYLFDLFRLATSFVLVARNNGLSDSSAANIVWKLVGHYIKKLADFKVDSSEDTWTWDLADIDDPSYDSSCNSNSENPIRALLDSANGGTKASRRKDMLNKYSTTQTNGSRIFNFAISTDIIDVNSATYNAIKIAWSSYYTSIVSTSFCVGSSPCKFATQAARDSYFAIQDIAQRVNAGLGSFGIERYYVIIAGYTSSADDDHIIDVKLQGYPSPYAYGQLPVYQHTFDLTTEQDDRTVYAMQKMLYKADDHLGTITFNSKVFSARERSPEKDALDPAASYTSAQLQCVAAQFGKVLASGHSKPILGTDGANKFEQDTYDCINMWDNEGASDPTSDTDFTDIKGEVANFALAYANQVQYDYSYFTSKSTTAWCT